MKETRQEFENIYKYVMRNCKETLKTKDEIIEYLVHQCYYIDIYNDELTDKINQIRILIGNDNFITEDDLPF